MKQKAKQFYSDNREWCLLVLCLLAGIPLAVWFSAWWYRHVDESWAVIRHNDSWRDWLFVSVFNTVWLFICHYTLLFINRFKKIF